MPINWWKDKQMWYSDTVEHYLSIKSEVMLSATAWMNLESIIFIGKRSQSELRPYFIWFHLYEVFRIHKHIHRDWKQISCGWRERRNEELLMSIVCYLRLWRDSKALSKWLYNFVTIQENHLILLFKTAECYGMWIMSQSCCKDS